MKLFLPLHRNTIKNLIYYEKNINKSSVSVGCAI